MGGGPTLLAALIVGVPIGSNGDVEATIWPLPIGGGGVGPEDADST
jgi:hypothetical protein